jgi:hypothetical protein
MMCPMFGLTLRVSRRRRRVQMAKWIALTTLLIGLPFAGLAIAGRPLDEYVEFPPKAIGQPPDEPLPMSWVAFAAYTAFVALFVGPVCLRLVSARDVPRPARAPFPAWGWAGLAFGAVAWTLAWTRFPWFAKFQAQTFVPLWLAYLVVANAMAQRAAGRAPALAATRRYVALFAASAVFWWSFEYLNRFARNWRYVGIDKFGPVDYGVLATLAFSTVLPAFHATDVAVAAWPRLDRAFASWTPIRFARPRIAAVAALLLSAAGLGGLGLWPDLLFPLVWVSPVLVLVGIQTLRGRPHVLSGIATGDWRRPVAAAAAALVCGLFWETWNSLSLAKWQYDIPYVGRFHLFEMPLLGYAGYLPFGLMCATVTDAIMPSPSTPAASGAFAPPADPTAARSPRTCPTRGDA